MTPLHVLREWCTRLVTAVSRRRSDADVEEELRAHRDFAVEEARRLGLAPDEAARAATLKVGTVAHAMDALRDQRRASWLEDLWRDLRYAGRTLSRARVFTITVVVSLALGIGANTAIVTLMDAVLFRTLPVEQPHRLFFLGHDPGPRLDLSANYPLFERYTAAPVFSGVTAYRGRTFKVRTGDTVEEVSGQYVSGNYHAVVGVPMALGRGFSSEQDRAPDPSLLAVIGHDYWVSHFDRDPDVIGKPLVVGDRTVTIIGVTAPGFYGLNAGARLQITLPLSVMVLDEPRFFNTSDGWIGFNIVARLANGISEAQALAGAETVFQAFLLEPAQGWVKFPNRQVFRAAALVPAARGTFGLRRQYEQPLWMLLAMVALLLVVACANVAVLFLARSAERSRELAVRMGIGASRSRLVRELLTESVVLALLGGAAGVLVSIWGTNAILSVFAIGPSPVLLDASVNGRVLAVTVAVVFLTAIGFGMFPAFRSTRLNLAPALANNSTVQGTPRHRLEKALVVSQVALSLVLVAAAGLLSTSLYNLQRFDAGFTRDDLLLANIDLGVARLSGSQRLRVFSDVLDRLQHLPGVQSATLSLRTPIDFSSQFRRIEVPGVDPARVSGVSPNSVTLGYFQTFGLELIRGRNFTDADRVDTPRVAVISATMARQFYGDDDPIGRTFVLAPSKSPTTIIGVVGDARHEQLRSETLPKMVYQPLSQPTGSLDGTIDVPTRLAVSLRTSADATALVPLIRSEVSTIDKDAMVLYVRTMAQQVDAALIPERLLTTLSTSFAAVALLLSCVGLYGVMAHKVSRRRREFGVRLALGAAPRALLYGVIREALAVSAIGVLVGVPIALATTRFLSTFLFGVTPRDASTLAATTGLLVAAAVIAGVLPARKAARLDPIGALKDQ